MEHLDGIVKIAGNELKTIVDNGRFRSKEEIDNVYKLMDIVKDAHCIWQYEDEESEYSEEGRSYDGTYARGSHNGGRGSNRGGSYRGTYEGMYDGGSYARGRNARRDSMGRYSRDSYRGGYSRDGKEEYIDQLRDMMEDAPDEQTRQSIQRMIREMEQSK